MHDIAIANKNFTYNVLLNLGFEGLQITFEAFDESFHPHT